MEGFGAIAATIQSLGQLVDLVASPTEDDRRGRCLDIENSTEGRRFMRPRNDECELAHLRSIPSGNDGSFDANGGRIGKVPARKGLDPLRHGRREQHRLSILGESGQNFVEIIGKAHVEHLVGLVEYDHCDVVERECSPLDVVDGSTRRGHDDIDATAECLELSSDRLATVDREHACSECTSVLVHRL